MAQRDHGLEEVLVLVNAIREQTEAEPRDMRAIFALMFEALGPDADLRDRMSEFSSSMRTDLAAALRRGIADGSIRGDIDPDIGAVLITAALTGLAYQWLLEPDSLHLSRSYAALGEFIQDHLAVK